MVDMRFLSRNRGSILLVSCVNCVCLFTYTVFRIDLILSHAEAEPPRKSAVLSEFNGLLLARELRPHEYHRPVWQRKDYNWSFETNYKRSYFLTGILHVRLYDSDVALWTLGELKQWLHYMFWAGIQHVYICSRFDHVNIDIIGPRLQRYVDAGLVTVLAWKSDPVNLRSDQVSCYRHMSRQYGGQSSWQLPLGIDEYPFCPNDVSEGFLSNYISRATAEHPTTDIDEIRIKRFLMLGEGDRRRNMTIDRITRIEEPPVFEESRQIFRPSKVSEETEPHGFRVRGSSMLAADDELRILKYWGTRTAQHPERLSETKEYKVVRETLAKTVRKSLLSYGEISAFNSQSGP